MLISTHMMYVSLFFVFIFLFSLVVLFCKHQQNGHRTALYWTSMNELVELLRFLLDHGADVNIREIDYNRTPKEVAQADGRMVSVREFTVRGL